MAKTVYQGGASIDENGKAYGGKDGDQKDEVRIRPWYIHKLGWVILRAKDPRVRKGIAYATRRAVENQKIGYNQWRRYTLQKLARAVGYDPGLVTTPCACDCSTLMYLACCYAFAQIGIDFEALVILESKTKGDFRTGNMIARMMATGLFDKLTDAKYCARADGAYLMEGDIAVTAKSGHTIAVLNDGDLAGTGEDEQPAPPTRPTIRRGSKGAAVKAAQTLLWAWRADALPVYGVDSDFGGETLTWVKRFQTAHKLTADGIVGAKTWASLDKYGQRSVTILPGNWNVRKGAGVEHDSVGLVVHGGETYPLVAERDGWYQIEVNGALGWVSGKGAEVK